MAQLVVPIAISIGAGVALQLPLAGWMWVPLIAVAVVGAALRMDNLSHAKADFAASLAAVKVSEMWLLAFLYIGTFGSFIGFSSVFPKLIADQFPSFSAFGVGSATLSLAFTGALIGSLARPLGGRLADRLGGSTVTIASFVVMALGAVAVIATLPTADSAPSSGASSCCSPPPASENGATYRMIPTVFALRAGTDDAHNRAGDVGSQRRTAAALGSSPRSARTADSSSRRYSGCRSQHRVDIRTALGWFVVAYVVMIAVTALFAVRGRRAGIRI